VRHSWHPPAARRRARDAAQCPLSNDIVNYTVGRILDRMGLTDHGLLHEWCGAHSPKAPYDDKQE
jgi:hypothetical protein